MKKLFCILFFISGSGPVFGQAGDQFFSYSQIHSVYINFYEPNYYDSLTFYKEQGDQTGMNTYISADVIIDDDTVFNVGVRFRGNSSYGHPGTKKPVQLDFNEFVSGQKYDGLKKLNLNNSYLDPTQIREKLMLDILRETGVPAPRSTYVKVYFNGEFIGLYKAQEAIDSKYLQSRFNNNDGNLYKCEPATPLTWEGNDQSAYYDNAELKTNDSINDWSDFVNFIYTINYSGPDFENNMRNQFNLDAYIKSWAANMVFGNLDAYFYLPHNYYLYNNTDSAKFEWITWDVSLAFGVYALLIVPNSVDFDVLYLPANSSQSRPLNYHILKDESLKSQYLSEICYYTREVLRSDKIFPRIDSIAAVIRPIVQQEPAQNRMFSLSEFESNLNHTTANYKLIGQIPGIKNYITSRKSSIIKQLCEMNWSCNQQQIVPNPNEINIYPNPGNSITVYSASFSEFYSTNYLVYDISGKKIMEWSNNAGSPNQTYSFNHLSSGVYVLKVDSGCKNMVKKFVVIKN